MQHRYLFSVRGGATSELNRYDIPYGVWDMVLQYPNMETLTTGSMFNYDQVDRIYFQKDATGRIDYYNIPTNQVVTSGYIPYGMGAAVIGSRMEIIAFSGATGSAYPKDLLRYLYVMRHSTNELFRVLIWW